jgi:hypothetical protein
VIIVGLLVGLVVLIGLGVASAGLLVVWGSGGNLWLRWAAFVGALRSRGWAETRGTVTRSVVAQGRYRRQVHYSAAIRYRYEVDGMAFEGERVDFVEQKLTFEAAQALVGRYPLGSDVRVFYEARTPARATLERTVPAIVPATLGWPITALVGGVVVWLGGDIVYGAFSEPPELGELPSLLEQLGGLCVGTGALGLVIAAIRALRERKTRRMLRYLASARATQAGNVREGEAVAVFGRAEDDVEGAVDPFGGEPVLYLHSDLGNPDGNFTQTTDFVVRDETGEVAVELSDCEALLQTEQVEITGEVERRLDAHELELGSSVFEGRRAAMKVQRLRPGDPVLVVGRAARASRARLVLRAHESDTPSLIFGDAPLPDVIKRLKRKPRTTLVMSAAAGTSILVGAIALTIG